MKRLLLLLCFARALGAQPAQGILIHDVTLIDGTGKPPVAGASVLIEGGRITRVGPGAITAPATVRRVDGRGKFLIPGLIDVHIHLSRGAQGTRALHGLIYSGFTSVFDAGNDPEYIFGLREQERAGSIVSPRIFATGGLVTVPGGHGGQRTSTLISSWPEAIPLLDAHIARKPDMVKFTFDEHGWGTRPLIPLLDSALMAKASKYFVDHGIRTTVHISHEYRARQAIAAGLTTLAHPIIQGPVSREFVQLMATTKTPMASTLTIGESYSRLVDHPEYLDQPLYKAVFEPAAIQQLRTTTRAQYATQGWTMWMKVMTPVCQENLRQIHAAGGIIALGSDQSNGPASHRELELMVAGGISALDAIKIGTLHSAIFLGKEKELGSIEVGKLADMVLLAADPAQNITNASRIDMVIKAGAIIDRSKLDLPVNRPPPS